jgi:hypothetical protein
VQHGAIAARTKHKVNGIANAYESEAQHFAYPAIALAFTCLCGGTGPGVDAHDALLLPLTGWCLETEEQNVIRARCHRGFQTRPLRKAAHEQ